MKDLIEAIINNPVPNLSYRNLEEDPIMVKTEWGRAEIDMADLVTYLDQIEDARREWISLINK